MKTMKLIAVLLSLLFAKCTLQDRVPGHCSVSLLFCARTDHKLTTAPSRDVEINECIETVDGLLVPRGYIHEVRSEGVGGRKILVNYARHIKETGQAQRGPIVILEADRVRVLFRGGGNVNSGLSAEYKKLCTLLEARLVDRFGTSRVRVQR